MAPPVSAQQSMQMASVQKMARAFRPAPLQALEHRVQWAARSPHSAPSSWVLQPARVARAVGLW
jgi:hypothetical protein